MAREPKTYGWIEQAREGQIRCVVLSPSKVQAARLRGYQRADQLWNLSQTWNEAEIAISRSKPGTIFFVPLSQQYRTSPPWQELKLCRKNS